MAAYSIQCRGRESNGLDPFKLACSIPRTTTTPLLLSLYRSLANNPDVEKSSHALNLLLMALIALSLTIDAAADGAPNQRLKSFSPSRLWDTARHRFSTHITRASDNRDRLKKIAETISVLIEYVEHMITTREESSEDWFSGVEWLGFADLWTGLGRKVRLFC